MPNQNDNKIEALRIEAEALNTLTREFQKKLDSFTGYVARTTKDKEVVVEEVDAEALAKQAEIEAQQAELIEEIAALEAGIEGHNSTIKAIIDDKKALQKQSEAEQAERKKKETKLKKVRDNLTALGVVIDETYDNPEKERVVNAEVDGKPANIRFTQLEEFKQPYTEDPNYHVGAPGTGSVVD